MNEKEISLVDLIMEILLKWRMILVWMLAGGLMMGCLSYIRSYQTAQAQTVQAAALEQQLAGGAQNELEYIRRGLTEQQINNVDTAICYENFWEAEDAYFQKSIKMQIDPLNMPKAVLTFQVVAEDEETAQQIEKVYEDMVPSGLGQWLSEKMQNETSEAALNELINLERKYENVSATAICNIFEEKSDTFSVAICHMSKEQCLQLAEKVDEYFQEQHSQLVHKMGDHQIQLVFQNFSYVMDTALLESRREMQNEMIVWNSSAAKLKENFSGEEWRYYNYLMTNELPEILPINISQPSINVKNVLIGIILFAFMYVFYSFIRYILNNKLRGTDDITSIYGIPELGMIPAEQKGKKILAFVDKWLLKLRDRNKRRFAMEEAIALAAAAVKISAKKENLTEICCIGCDLKTNATKTVETIHNLLKDAGISVKVLNNVLYDQEKLEQLLCVKGAFLLERAGKTLYDEVRREIELLRNQEIKVLGIIVVE
ncbi:MAG: hypothetical protein NC121_04525 [Blautia sp.]|nr:hypothetical protein [Blautia sp.]